MASIDAKNVAREVLDTLGKNKKVVLRKIAKKNGYADNTASNPKNIVETKSYQDVVAPIVKKMETERMRLMMALESKDLTKEEYRTMIDGVDKLTKNHQLLTGGKTESSDINISWDK